jgi:prophage regulatory protein
MIAIDRSSFQSRFNDYLSIVRSHMDRGLILRQPNGRDHAPTISISDDMPECGGGGGTTDGQEVSASDDDDGGDADPEPDRRPRKASRNRNLTSHAKRRDTNTPQTSNDAGDYMSKTTCVEPRKTSASNGAVDTPPPLLWALPNVIQSVALCRSQLLAMVQRGDFPEPIKIGRSSRWLPQEVMTWVSNKAADRSTSKAAG